MTLNENNGPYHNREGRGCSADAPVYCNSESGEIVFRLPYYYIGHISKFVQRGASVVNFSSYTDELDACAFKNPSGETVLVVMNGRDEEKKLIVRREGHIYKTEMPPHSIASFIISEG